MWIRLLREEERRALLLSQQGNDGAVVQALRSTRHEVLRHEGKMLNSQTSQEAWQRRSIKIALSKSPLEGEGNKR